MSELAEKLIAENLKMKSPVLDLSECELITEKPHQKSLNLLGNNLRKPSDYELLQQCRHLKSLDLSKAHLDNISFLSELVFLENLDLSYNYIQDISALAKLKNLKSLSINFNYISDMDPLSKLDKLVRLDLSENPFQNIEFLENLRNLNYLDLSKGVMKDDTFLSEAGLSHLKSHRFMKIEETILKKLENLTYLNFDLETVSYPPVWYVYLRHKNGKLGDYIHLSELPFVEKIWMLLKNKEEKDIELAEQLAISQGWTVTDFEMYKGLHYV